MCHPYIESATALSDYLLLIIDLLIIFIVTCNMLHYYINYVHLHSIIYLRLLES